jgi:hypothetical protein
MATLEPAKDKDKKKKGSSKEDDRKNASIKKQSTKVAESPTKVSGRKSPLSATTIETDPPNEDTGIEPVVFKEIKPKKLSIKVLSIFESQEVVPPIPEANGSEVDADEVLNEVYESPPPEKVQQQHVEET